MSSILRSAPHEVFVVGNVFWPLGIDVNKQATGEKGDGGLGEIGRDNMTTRVYGELRLALMEGRFQPGHRFKIRELALSLGVSETPIREALMQLVRERALTMKAARSVEVARLTANQYEELRSIRLMLEGQAAESATSRIGEAEIQTLKALNEQLYAAERSGQWNEAVRVNWKFHHTLYQAADKPELLALIETIWLRNGPVLNMAYPHAPPTYPGPHQHLNVIAGLEARDPQRVKTAIQADLLEGGANLLRHLRELEARGAPAA
jgi:DNA-binding GntR family transcriptional regulator